MNTADILALAEKHEAEVAHFYNLPAQTYFTFTQEHLLAFAAELVRQSDDKDWSDSIQPEGLKSDELARRAAPAPGAGDIISDDEITADEISDDEWFDRLGRSILRIKTEGKRSGSLLRKPLKAGERMVCYCPPGVCQAPKGFSGPCNRAPEAAPTPQAASPKPSESLTDAEALALICKHAVCGDTPQPVPSSEAVARCIEWLRNNYQDHANIADLCDAMRAALATLPATPAAVPISEVAQQAIDALEAAKNGLEWWNDAYAATDGSEADHEMIAQIDAAILALATRPQGEAK